MIEKENDTSSGFMILFLKGENLVYSCVRVYVIA